MLVRLIPFVLLWLPALCLGLMIGCNATAWWWYRKEHAGINVFQLVLLCVEYYPLMDMWGYWRTWMVLLEWCEPCQIIGRTGNQYSQSTERCFVRPLNIIQNSSSCDYCAQDAERCHDAWDVFVQMGVCWLSHPVWNMLRPESLCANVKGERFWLLVLNNLSSLLHSVRGDINQNRTT